MTKRIILADDEAHVLDVLSMKLSKAGFEVATATDGRRALELCREQPPDLVITDCQMPLMDGLELCKQLRDDSATRNVPAIMLTAREFEVPPEQARQIGLTSVLPKPFSPRDILEKTIACLGKQVEAKPVGPDATQNPGDTDPLTVMQGIAEQLARKASNLRVHVGVWKPDGRVLREWKQNRFCELHCGTCGACEQANPDAARQGMETKAPCSLRGELGCAVIGIPVLRDGRVYGAVTISLPVREMATPQMEEALRAKAGQDGRALAEALSDCRRYEADQAQDMLEAFSWLLQAEHELIDKDRNLQNLSAALSLTYEELDLVYRLSAAIRINQAPQQFLRNVCRELTGLMDVEAVAAVVAPRRADEEEMVVLVGDVGLNVDQIKMLMSTQVAPRLQDDPGKGFIENRFSPPEGSGLPGELRTFLAAGLMSDDKQLGTLLCLNHKQNDFNSVDLKLVSSVAGQSAAFLANQALYADLHELFLGVLRALTASIDAKDAYTGRHSDRVANLSRDLARQLGLDEQQAKDIHLAGLLHDIGKIGVPEAVLRKPGKLTDEEFEQLKKHPALGAEILRDIRQLEGVIEGILSHHERYDGGGYPRGLSGEDVPIAGRIVSLADAFDAMASTRPYREALSLDVVVDELQKCAGNQFDPRVVEALLSLDLDDFLE